MKFFVLLCVVSMASAFYTDIDETIDMDALMADPKKLQPFMDCFLDKQPCPKQAKPIKGEKSQDKNHFH